jgi:20S proteasome alpha/beta subunit
MTTIAFKSGVLAADSMACIGNRKSTTNKIHHVDGKFVIAGAGALADIMRVVEYVRENGLSECSRLFDIEAFPSAIAIDINEGTPYRLERGIWLVITDAFYAIGSGADFALGAMAMGADAVAAVQHAAALDIYTAGPVLHYRLGELDGNYKNNDEKSASSP